MRKTRIPHMLVNLVLTALTACDGIVFDEREACLLCGSRLSGYNKNRKQLVIIHDG